VGKAKLHIVAETQEEVLREAAQAFCALMRKSFAWFQGVAAEQELSPLQAKILMFLSPEHPCRMSEVAELAACEPSHITGVVDKLEARKLVKRGSVKGDRRAKHVEITKAGLAVRAKLATRLSEPAPWMLSLSAKDQRQLRDILCKGVEFEALP
jgi:DNA-binding MarR family transcriptional regulator